MLPSVLLLLPPPHTTPPSHTPSPSPLPPPVKQASKNTVVFQMLTDLIDYIKHLLRTQSEKHNSDLHQKELSKLYFF